MEELVHMNGWRTPTLMMPIIGMLAAGALWLLVAAGAAYADGPDDPPPASAKDGKVSSALLDALADATRPRGLAAAATAADDPEAGDPPEDSLGDSDVEFIRFDDSGRVQVYVYVRSTSPQSLATLRRDGLEIDLLSEDAGIVLGWLAPADLDRIADQEFVRWVTLPDYAVPRTGSVETEGDAILRSHLVRALTDYTGAGVRIGVISDSVDGLESAQASGDLPAHIFLDPYRAWHSGSGEGTAMLEIIHDIAPGAELVFSSARVGFQMVTAIEWMAQESFDGDGADIIVDDLGFYDSSYFEDGIIAQAAARAAAEGRIFVSSAGNDARGHYSGEYVANDFGYHDFGDGDTSLRVGNVPVHALAHLQWNDRYGASSNDFDLYACSPGLTPTQFNLDNNYCTVSSFAQDGDDNPAEQVFLLGPSDLFIHGHAVDPYQPHQLKLRVLGGRTSEHQVAAGAVYGHSAAKGVISVAAIDAADPGHDDTEPFSSQGPTEIYFPTRETRQTPTITGIDGVLVTGAAGFPNPFFGTSAAAPHVAAIAALALEADRRVRPDSSPQDAARRVHDALARGAVDLGEPGRDNVFGWGRADAMATMEALTGSGGRTYVVDSTGDGSDSNAVDDSCDDGGGNCTLRAAIEQANAGGGARIKFKIPGSGPHAIRPASPLPPIGAFVLIDGHSQAVPETHRVGIELVGSRAGNSANGFTLVGGDSRVSGLAINRFGGYGIAVQSGDRQAIRDNLIGTDTAGNGDLGNGGGVSIAGSSHSVVSGNVISGNDGNGVVVTGATAYGTAVVANRIGTNAAGDAALGNAGTGVRLSNGARDNRIANNTIAFNGGDGVAVQGSASIGNLMQENSIHSNGGLGIDLGGDGITANDRRDQDDGPNRLQNFPTLDSATLFGESNVFLTVRGGINSTPNTQLAIEFYSNDSCDGSGHGEGQEFLESRVVRTDGSGNASIWVGLNAGTPEDANALVGRHITATVAQYDGNPGRTGSGTSEFSSCVATERDRKLLNLSTDRLNAVEGSIVSYTVQPAEAPDENFVVQVISNDERVAIAHPLHLTFTPDNWNTPQQVTVTMPQDDDADDEEALVAHSLVRGFHRELAALVDVEVSDDDLPALTLPDGILEVSEGATATYDVALAAQPSANVMVSLTSTDGKDDTVAPHTLTFTTDDWATTRTVTVTGQQDDDARHNLTSIRHSVTLGGKEYILGVKRLFTLDDDRVGLMLNPNAITMNEDASATYTVALAQEPATTAEVLLTSSNTDVATVEPRRLTFTQDDWNTEQTVTVRGVGDVDGDDETTQIKKAFRAPDGKYYFATRLSVAVADGDTAPYFTRDARQIFLRANSPPGTDLRRGVIDEGRPIRAGDPTGLGLIYEISGGADAALFRIDRLNGQISVGPATVVDLENPSDHDKNNHYELVVRATNVMGESDSIKVTIAVSEDPSRRPAPPWPPQNVTISLPADSPDTGLTLDWSPARDGAGTPAKDYDYRWRVAGTARWKHDKHTPISGAPITVRGLESGVAYQMQVRAGDPQPRGNTQLPGGWSPAVTGRTATDANDPPFFIVGVPETTREISEDAPAGTAVGAPFIAVDAEADPLTYSLAGPDAAQFDIDPATGQLTVAEDARLDYETAFQLSVTVSVTDGKNAAGGADPASDATIAVAIRVTDVDEERTSLTALYNATDGANWKRSNFWNSQRELQHWQGVLADADGRVTTLELHDNNLSGTLPAELGNLTALQSLNLSANSLTGALPAEVGNLVNLQRLVLINNPDLSGPLPQELTNLVNLEYLKFQDTGLCAPPNRTFREWLDSVEFVRGGHCPTPDRAALVALYQATGGHDWRRDTHWLSDKPLDEWHGVTTDADGRVTGLSLIDNKLTGEMPTQLQALERLQTLDLSDNSLSGTLPSWLGDLSGLQTLNLRLNSVHGPVPTEVGRLSNLVELHLGYTRLTGELPQSLTGLTNLKQLTFSTGLCSPNNDQFQEWLAGLESYTDHNCPPPDPDREALTAFYHAMGGDNWTNNNGWLSQGALRHWHGVSTDADGRVVMLSLLDSNLAGTLPSDLEKLERLEVLALDRNSLSGRLPTELGNLRNLTRLALNRNQLTGSIPSQLGNLSNLSIIGLANNQLSGALPASLGNLNGLTRLSLHDNTGLSGALPSGFIGLANLQRLAIANTGLCAPDDEAFREWLDTVPDKPGGVQTCE